MCVCVYVFERESVCVMRQRVEFFWAGLLRRRLSSAAAFYRSVFFRSVVVDAVVVVVF